MIEWATKDIIKKTMGMSRALIEEALDSGRVKYAQNKKGKTSKIFVNIPSLNKYWEEKAVVK